MSSKLCVVSVAIVTRLECSESCTEALQVCRQRTAWYPKRAEASASTHPCLLIPNSLFLSDMSNSLIGPFCRFYFQISALKSQQCWKKSVVDWQIVTLLQVSPLSRLCCFVSCDWNVNAFGNRFLIGKKQETVSHNWALKIFTDFIIKQSIKK